MTECTHQIEIPIEDMWVDDFGEMHYSVEYDVLWTLKDITPGTSVCTQCGEIVRNW